MAQDKKTIVSAESVGLLLNRIDGYLMAEREAGGGGRTYHPMHPATLLAEAQETIGQLLVRLDGYVQRSPEDGGAALGATLAGIADAMDRADK